MNSTIRSLVLFASLATCFCSAKAAEFKFVSQTFTVPDGFEVQLVAGPGLVQRPITADFDENGRLYVTDSSGSNDKVDKQLQEKPHRILRLEDTDGDGVFDKSTVFADKMMFPEGCLWYEGSLYVAAPPSIWKLTDTDGDGVADQRAEWFQGKTLTGCANDLHGPTLGPDGWIYWCKGAFAQQTYPRPGKSDFVTRAAHIFRARPDGSGIEPVLTGGMDNPVSVAFTAGGERILTGTFFVHPGGGQRDGLIHAVYGGVYGKENDVLDGHKRTGELMPIMTQHGPSASCFVIRYQSAAFGSAYQDNVFACLFNLHKVMRHVLVPDGASFKTKDEDFLVSDNPDFHPTCLVEDGDGSLLVVDTGGWYKICCPTSQLWKPDVLGAIYRVRKSGAKPGPDPRGLHIAWTDASPEILARLLDDPRLPVRERAMKQLAANESGSVPALQAALTKASHTAETRRNAVWTLTRIDTPPARAAIAQALDDSDATVREVALHSISLRRDNSAVGAVLHQLEASTAPVQRVAAEALGRLGAPSAVPALLAAVPSTEDRVLEHSITYALIEIDDPSAVRQAMQSVASVPRAHALALIALDQMDNGGLEAGTVAPLLTSADPMLKRTASWIVSHHTDWGKDLTSFFRQRLTQAALAPDEAAELERHLALLSPDDDIQALLAEAARDPAFPSWAQLAALRAMGRASLKHVPASWTDALGQVLRSANAPAVGAAVGSARNMSLPRQGNASLIDELRKISQAHELAPGVRLDALSAIPGGLNPVDAPTFDFLRAHLASSEPVMVRSAAAGILGKAVLTPEQLRQLAEAIKTAGPLEVPRLLSAFDRSSDEAVGQTLLAALKESPGLSSLRPETLKPHLTNFPAQVQSDGVQLAASLNGDAGKQQAHLDELAAALTAGDIRRGQAIFNGQKAACSSCHAIGYLGGNVGPDLTRIGQVRTERDLLESIVYPSASFVRSFEPVLITTKSGDDYNGVVKKDASDEIVLATGPGAEVRVARADIADMRPGSVSVMPAGLDEQLSHQELADLIAFLRATRW